MNIIAIYGAGLLVGAAIIIILPEGMLVLFESMISPEIIGELGLDTHATYTTPTTSTTSNVTTQARTTLAAADPHNPSTLIDPKVIQYAGLSLIFGFSLMLILDQGFLIIQERAMNRKVLKELKVRDADLQEDRDGQVLSPRKKHFEVINGGSDHDQ